MTSAPNATTPPRWLYGFLLLQFTCQAALVAPLGSARSGFRIATFASSLVLLALLPPGGRPHPLRPLALAVIGLTALGMLHPDLNSPLAGLAQVGLTAAVWSPLLWGTRLRLGPADLRRAVLMLWGFHTLSAAAGVLQVYDPGRFMPDPEFARQLAGSAAEGLMITLDDGTRIWRPMGLTDSPGGAAASGFFVVLGGLVLATAERGAAARLSGVCGAVAGMFCLYLCQIRSLVVLTGLGVAAFLTLQVLRGQAGRALLIAGAAGVAGAGGFVWAAAVGSEAVTSRLETLVEERADKVYYKNRGVFLEEAAEKLPDYPLGAGVGRWGWCGG